MGKIIHFFAVLKDQFRPVPLHVKLWHSSSWAVFWRNSYSHLSQEEKNQDVEECDAQLKPVSLRIYVRNSVSSIVFIDVLEAK